MRTLALDLGKQKTAAFLLDRDRDEQRHTTVKTTSAALHDLIVAMSPQRVVFEICPIAGWLYARGNGSRWQGQTVSRSATW